MRRTGHWRPNRAGVDGNREVRRGTISAFNGPMPVVRTLANTNAETEVVARRLKDCVGSGIRPGGIGVFVRSSQELSRAEAAAVSAGLPRDEPDATADTSPDEVSIAAMHLAKGLEIRAVAVMACDEDVLPLRARLDTAADESDVREVHDTERHLLYVACTRGHEIARGSPASTRLRSFSTIWNAASQLQKSHEPNRHFGCTPGSRGPSMGHSWTMNGSRRPEAPKPARGGLRKCLSALRNSGCGGKI